MGNLAANYPIDRIFKVFETNDLRMLSIPAAQDYMHVYDHYLLTYSALKQLCISKSNFKWILLGKEGHEFIKMVSRSHDQVFVVHNVQTYPLKPLGQLKPNFMWSRLGKGGTKQYINGPGHMTKMATTPIYGKNLLKSFRVLEAL